MTFIVLYTKAEPFHPCKDITAGVNKRLKATDIATLI